MNLLALPPDGAELTIVDWPASEWIRARTLHRRRTMHELHNTALQAQCLLKVVQHASPEGEGLEC